MYLFCFIRLKSKVSPIEDHSLKPSLKDSVVLSKIMMHKRSVTVPEDQLNAKKTMMSLNESVVKP